MRWRCPSSQIACTLGGNVAENSGDGNLHPLILFDANDPDQLHRCELFGKRAANPS